MKKIAAVLAALAAILGAAALSPSNEIVINENLDIEGPVSNLRAFVQGERFWLGQRRLIEVELAWHAAAPERQEQLKVVSEKADQAVKHAEASLEKVYARMPEARPTPEQQQAAELRRQANRIEAEGAQRIVDEITAKRVLQLRRTLAALATRDQ